MRSSSRTHAVGNHFVGLSGKIQMMAVRQMAAMRKIHAEDRVAGIQHGGVGGLVRLRTGMRLHVGIFGMEQLLRAIARQILHHVGMFAAAVIPLAGITFGVLVGEHAAGRFEHRLGGEIFARNQFQPRVLPLGFLADQIRDFGIHLGQRPRHFFLFRHMMKAFVVKNLLPVSRFFRSGASAGRRRAVFQATREPVRTQPRHP